MFQKRSNTALGKTKQVTYPWKRSRQQVEEGPGLQSGSGKPLEKELVTETVTPGTASARYIHHRVRIENRDSEVPRSPEHPDVAGRRAASQCVWAAVPWTHAAPGLPCLGTGPDGDSKNQVSRGRNRE